MNTNTTLKQQLEKHNDDIARKEKIEKLEERLNTLLSNEKITNYIKKSLSLGFSALYDNKNFFATLTPCRSSATMVFDDTYNFSIFFTQEQAVNERKLYKFQGFFITATSLADYEHFMFYHFDEEGLEEVSPPTLTDEVWDIWEAYKEE